MRRPSVTVRNDISRRADVSGAAMPGETIVEFMFADGKGGLISFAYDVEGNPRVELYRCDAGIHVRLDSLTDHTGGVLLAASDMSTAKVWITK